MAMDEYSTYTVTLKVPMSADSSINALHQTIEAILDCENSSEVIGLGVVSVNDYFNADEELLIVCKEKKSED